nr:hypothetical protein [Tanacetum cinerariifolium]
MFVESVIQNQFFSNYLEDFAKILDIPCEGACTCTHRWSLDVLAYGFPSDGPYQTNSPSPNDIILSIRIDREDQVCRIRHEEEIESENLERIVAREEVVIPPPRPPSINHIHLISMMMMMMIELMKGPHVQLFVNISSDEDVTTTLSPTTTSLSPNPPNAPSKTTSTNQTSSSQENTSTSFQSKLQILPPSSNEPTSPHPLNPLLDNILDVPPRPLDPQPL